VSVSSREAVDRMVADALAAGGSPATAPQDLGFMYNASFRDPDGHNWEAFWMDPAALAG
jgi:predicted lactoylglutathione lyase